MVDNPKLTPRQERFIAAMLTERSIRQAAERANVADRTARTWLRQEPVRRALSERISEQLAASAALSSGALSEALDVLRSIMAAKETSPAVKVSAARAVLEAGQKTIELHNFDLRLAALEGRLNESR